MGISLAGGYIELVTSTVCLTTYCTIDFVFPFYLLSSGPYSRTHAAGRFFRSKRNQYTLAFSRHLHREFTIAFVATFNT